MLLMGKSKKWWNSGCL